MGQMGYATTKDAILGDWALIAFYYLLRVGKYTPEVSWNEPKQIVEFCMMNVTFFKFDSTKCIKQMPRDALDGRIKKADRPTLYLPNQKNGWKNVHTFYFANGDGLTCPV